MKDNSAKHLIVNIFTSGKYFVDSKLSSSDYFIRYVVMNFILLLGLSVFIYYGLESLVNNAFWEFLVYLVMMTCVITTIIIARTNLPQIIPGTISFIFFGFFCTIMLWVGYTYGSIVLFLYPLLAIMVVGMKIGSLLSFVLFLLICFFSFIPGMSQIQYNLNQTTQILANYLVVFVISIVLENTRVSKDKVIGKQKVILENQKQELQKFNENLQDLVNEKTIKVVKLQNAILSTMSDLVEYRDYITGEHAERTQYGVNILLNEIKEQKAYVEIICSWDIPLLLQSTPLHDIGKIAISDKILKKPGPLNGNEFNEMKKHTIYGHKIIERIEANSGESTLLNHAKVFALTHHEKWNGTGYPNGICGDNIPLQGRLMAIADVYDALISERPYKKAYTHDEAVKIIIDGKGTQFDPLLIELFKDISDKFDKSKPNVA